MAGLLERSKEYRENNLSKNTYTANNKFSSSHPNALSDGDTKGRGEFNGSIGTSVDIDTRKKNVSKNKYNSNNIYDLTKT